MAAKDCQVVLRGHRRISARRINWTVCGATNSADHKRHWIRFMVSNHPVAVIKDSHGYLIFPREHIFVDCMPLNVTRITIVHEEPSILQPYEQLSQSQRTASYTIRGAWTEEETDEIVDCHSVETGYIATYTDQYSGKVTFRVDYNQPIQVSLIDWYYQTDVYGNKAKDEDYHVQNVIQNQDLVKIWEEAVGNPPPMVTTTMVTVPGGPLTEVIMTERPTMKPVVTVGTMKPGQTTEAAGEPSDDDDTTMAKPRKPQEKEGSKNNKAWVIPVVILILFVAIILAVTGCVFWQRSKSERDRRAKEAARRLQLINAIERVNKADDGKGGTSSGSRKGDS